MCTLAAKPSASDALLAQAEDVLEELAGRHTLGNNGVVGSRFLLYHHESYVNTILPFYIAIHTECRSVEASY